MAIPMRKRQMNRARKYGRSGLGSVPPCTPARAARWVSSSVGQSSGLLSRQSQVRVLSGPLNQSNTNGECQCDRPQAGTFASTVRPGATFDSDHANVACAARGMNSTPRGNLFREALREVPRSTWIAGSGNPLVEIKVRNKSAPLGQGVRDPGDELGRIDKRAGARPPRCGRETHRAVLHNRPCFERAAWGFNFALRGNLSGGAR